MMLRLLTVYCTKWCEEARSDIIVYLYVRRLDVEFLLHGDGALVLGDDPPEAM
jgi:hypothetical protein